MLSKQEICLFCDKGQNYPLFLSWPVFLVKSFAEVHMYLNICVYLMHSFIFYMYALTFWESNILFKIFE